MTVSCFYNELGHGAQRVYTKSISTITDIFPWCINSHECVVTVYIYGHAPSVKSDEAPSLVWSVVNDFRICSYLTIYWADP